MISWKNHSEEQLDGSLIILALSYTLLCFMCLAVAGEVAKDAKHLAMVEKAGGDFIPLCVECFGVWTPFALSTLNSIADRTITCSGISRKLARQNLLQQLSISLWISTRPCNVMTIFPFLL